MSHSENVDNLTADEIREAVRDNYGKVAERNGEGGCCGTSTGCGTGSACCAPGEETEITVDALSAALGYSPDELASAPHGANLGLGCGNPKPSSRIMADAAHRCVARSKLLIIPGANHGAPWQNTTAFNELLLEFLTAGRSASKQDKQERKASAPSPPARARD